MALRHGYSQIGLDLGETSAKMVQLRADKRGAWQLHAVARMGYPPGGDGDGKADVQATVSMIKRMLAEHHFVGRNVATVLRRTDVLIRPVNLPSELDHEDTKQIWEALQSESRRYLPYPPEEAVLEFLTVGKIRDDEEEEKLEVLLISAPENKVSEHLLLLRTAGLRCTCIDIVPCAVMRTAGARDGEDSEDAVVMVEIGDRATVVGIFRAGQLLFSRSMNTGGRMLTDAIAKTLGLPADKAETFKRNYGIDHRAKVTGEFSDDTRIPPRDMPGILYELCQEELKRLSHEIKRSVDYFVTQFRGIKVDKALLFGGGANLGGLPEFLADETGLKAQVGDPFVSVRTDNGALDEHIDKDRASLSVALGLALREG